MIVLISVVAVLLALSLMPQRQRVIPDEAILLENAQVTLYPQADPEAVWQFSAPNVDYHTQRQETTLFNIQDGKRLVNNETDFTLRSERITIDANDNLRGDNIFVHLIDANWNLDMQGRAERQVYIQQREGKFEIPILDYSGDGIDSSHDENVRMNFDLTDFEAGGPDSIGYNRFVETTP